MMADGKLEMVSGLAISGLCSLLVMLSQGKENVVHIGASQL